MADKLLILNCDDFGQCEAANRAIMHLLEEGRVSSATLMPPAPGFREAADWCRKKSVTNVGLHLTLTSEFDGLRWTSLTGHPSLHDETGHMYRTVEEFERKADAKAVRLEIQAQFRAVREAGLAVSHVDNHMGSLYGLATGRSFLPQVLWQCARRGLPFRLPRRIDPRDRLLASAERAEQRLAQVTALADAFGVGLPDWLLSHPYAVEAGETYDSFKRSVIRRLYELPDGVCELFIHPAADDERMRRLIPHWEKRVWEYRLPLDDDFRYALRDARVVLTDYRHVQTHLRRPRLRAVGTLLRLLGRPADVK
jgi:predicted glycoside hydrolase/deacetylase ChbG (UPF0249 family)